MRERKLEHEGNGARTQGEGIEREERARGERREEREGERKRWCRERSREEGESRDTESRARVRAMEWRKLELEHRDGAGRRTSVHNADEADGHGIRSPAASPKSWPAQPLPSRGLPSPGASSKGLPSPDPASSNVAVTPHPIARTVLGRLGGSGRRATLAGKGR